MQTTQITRTIFIPSPADGVGIFAESFYSRAHTPELVSIHSYITRSDTCDVAYRRRSHDNGRSWSEPVEIVTGETRPGGAFRRHLRAGIVDPRTDRFVLFWTEAILPTDSPLEGLLRWRVHYSVSEDGGDTDIITEPVICSGDEFDAGHPLPGVFHERNAFMMGDMTCVPLLRPDGSLLLPCQIGHLGPDGYYASPGGGMTYTDAVILHGRWRADGGLAWEASAPIVGDPARTTRGMIEPTLAELADGRLLVVMRGSNDVNPALLGYRWHAYSEDGGMTWSTPEPWGFTDGEPFFSPSSCSQLLAHSGGTLWWLGNISPQNPRGNAPRYPLILAQVDQASGRLIRDTVCVIDDRGPADDAALTLSNFHAREDRETGDILLHLPRFMARGAWNWTSDALLYRIALPA